MSEDGKNFPWTSSWLHVNLAFPPQPHARLWSHLNSVSDPAPSCRGAEWMNRVGGRNITTSSFYDRTADSNIPIHKTVTHINTYTFPIKSIPNVSATPLPLPGPRDNRSLNRRELRWGKIQVERDGNLNCCS